MPHKKKALDQQESQQLAPESYMPLGREPMTGAQASYLKMLAEEVREPSVFQQGLSKGGSLAAHRCADGASEDRRSAAPHGLASSYSHSGWFSGRW
jgi:hypothetical protein